MGNTLLLLIKKCVDFAKNGKLEKHCRFALSKCSIWSECGFISVWTVTYFWSVWLGSGFMLLKCLVQIRFCLKYLTQIRFCFVEMFDRFGLVLLICLTKIRIRIIELSDSDPVLLLKYLPQIWFSVIKMSFSDPVLCYWNVWLGSEYMYWSFSSDPNPCYWKVLGTGSNAISALI